MCGLCGNCQLQGLGAEEGDINKRRASTSWQLLEYWDGSPGGGHGVGMIDVISEPSARGEAGA